MPSILNKKRCDPVGIHSLFPFNNIELIPYLDLFERLWYLHITSLIEDIKGGESSSQVQWFTIAKIEL